MELLFALAALLAVGWLIAKGVAQDPPESPATRPESIPQPKTEVLRTDARWLGAGTSVSVHGIALHGGLLYVGHGLRAVSGDRPEPALVDPQLPVDLVHPDYAGAGLPYWACYDRIPPSSRAAYLYWLASGRRDPAAAIGYVFLYFYGLERRVLAEATQVEDARTEFPAIRDEIAALLEVYGSNNSFRRYASQLLDVIGAVLDDGNLAPPPRGNADQLPLRIRVRLAQFAKEGAPVPAEWAFSWVTAHPTTVLPTAARRCANEFRSLFLSRYTGKFDEGLVLHTGQDTLSLTLAPASPTFGGQMVIELSVQDISDSSGSLAKLQDLADECAADLDWA